MTEQTQADRARTAPTTPRRSPRLRRSIARAAALPAIGGLAAACGDGGDDTASADPSAQASGEDNSTASDRAASDQDMSDDAATAMAPSGSACSSVPADGEGSFDGMADDPAAT